MCEVMLDKEAFCEGIYEDCTRTNRSSDLIHCAVEVFISEYRCFHLWFGWKMIGVSHELVDLIDDGIIGCVIIVV